MSQSTPEFPRFSTKPFYVPRSDRPITKDIRVCRPVLDAPGQNGLQVFYEQVIGVLRGAGLGEEDATVLTPDAFEVSIASRGTINTAAGSGVLKDMTPEVVGGELLRIIKPAHDVPIEGLVGAVGTAKRYAADDDRAGRLLHIAAFLDLTRGEGRVEVERFLAYEALGVWSNNPAVKAKLQAKKRAMFRFAAIHTVEALSPALLQALKPKEPVRVVLGAPKVAKFGNL